MFRNRWCVGLAVLICLFVARVAVAEELHLGTTEGVTSGDDHAQYEYTARRAGVLTLVVRADEDVALEVTNEDGRQVPNGYIDIDFEGDLGAEQAAVVLSGDGSYRVTVMPLDRGNITTSFVLIASWLPTDEVARQVDPAEAEELRIGATIEGETDPAAGNVADWYRIEARRDGLLVVATRTRSGDAVLQAFSGDDKFDDIASSDNDHGGDHGREWIVRDVQAGEVIFIVVSGFRNSPLDYSIRASISDN